MKTLPTHAHILGIRYIVSCSDGVVMFSEETTIYGHHNQLNFTRTRHGEMWYVQLDETFDKAPVKHITKIHELLEEWFGEECP